VQRFADRLSAVFVPVVVVLAALTCADWLLTGRAVATAIVAALAVLVITSPCALGLATLTAIMVGTERGKHPGITRAGQVGLQGTRLLTESRAHRM
jgi:P-type Cu+ transporter